MLNKVVKLISNRRYRALNVIVTVKLALVVALMNVKNAQTKMLKIFKGLVSALTDIMKIRLKNSKILLHVYSATLNVLLAMEETPTIAYPALIPMLKAFKTFANV